MSGAAGGRLTTMLLSGLAGYGGIQYGMAAERGEAPSFLSTMGELALRGMQNRRDQDSSTPSRETDLRLAQLERSLDRFDGKLDRLASSGPTVVYTGNSGTDTAKYAIVGLACVAGAGYAYVWYKGWTYDDLVYVSQKALDECAAGLKTTVEGVSERVQNVKAEVLQRLFNMEESLEGKIEDGQRELAGKIMGVGHEVRDIENKLTLMDGRLCYSNRGIHLLCNVLATSLLQGTSENNLPPEWMELRRFTSNNAEYIGAIDGGSEGDATFATSLLKDGRGDARESERQKEGGGFIAAIAKNATPDIRESINADGGTNMNFGSPLINSLMRTPSNESAGAAIHKSRSSRRRSLGL